MTVPGKVSRERNERVYAEFRWLWRSFAAKTWRGTIKEGGRESRRQSVRRPVLMRLSFKTVRDSLPPPVANSGERWHSMSGTWPERLFSLDEGRSTFRPLSWNLEGGTPGGYFISRGICSPRMQRFSPELSVARRAQETEKLRLFFVLFFFQTVFLVPSKFLKSFFINFSEREMFLSLFPLLFQENWFYSIFLQILLFFRFEIKISWPRKAMLKRNAIILPARLKKGILLPLIMSRRLISFPAGVVA